MSELGVQVGGYPLEIFRNGFDSKLLCNACNKVLRDPVQSYCGHRFCRECISAIISSGNQVKCKSCIEEGVDNEDYSIIRKEQLFPDNALRREMFSMESNCSNPGCSWTGKFRDFEKHVKECKYQPIPCPNCGVSVEVSKMKSHVENDCPKRPATCKYCSLPTKHDEMEQHKEECPKRPTKCESCGKKKIPKDKIQEHKDSDCPNEKLPCLAGCEAVERRRFVAHIEENSGFHIQQVMEVLSRLSNDLKSEQITRNNNNMQQNDNNTTSLPSNGAAHSANDSDCTKIKTLEIKVSTFEGIVTTLHREAERILGVLDERQQEIEALKEENERKSQKIRELERKQANNEVQVMQINQRVLASDGSSYNGELVWRIEKWSEHRARAVAGSVTSIFSPQFYTSKYGYKMCVRLYPNGDGMGKNTHVSIFFAVLRSDYDPVLSWPFSQRVRFTVFDQTSGIHITDSFRTDPNSSSFQRPTTDMNIASGCPLFLPLTRLNGDNGFVKEDVMFIRTKVEEIR